VIVLYIQHETYSHMKCLKFIYIICSISLPYLFSWLPCVVFIFFCCDHPFGMSKGRCKHWSIGELCGAFNLILRIGLMHSFDKNPLWFKPWVPSYICTVIIILDNYISIFYREFHMFYFINYKLFYLIVSLLNGMLHSLFKIKIIKYIFS